MIVMIKIMVFWDMAPCSLVEMYHVSEEPAASIFRSEEYSEDAGSRLL
jgi:hypothetical protein